MVVIAIKCFLTILETVKYKLRNREDSVHGDFKVRKYNPVFERNYVYIHSSFSETANKFNGRSVLSY